MKWRRLRLLHFCYVYVMKLYSENSNYKLYHGDMLDMLDVIEEDSITSIVCDPPYELGFMSRDWDKMGISFSVDAWKTCLKVLKPGGHLVAFCGSRTFHRMVCAIEDAGFEIRDTIMWIYGSGMPKSSNVGKMLEKKYGHPVDDELYKYGNALKPAYEPIVIARKPFDGPMIENMLKNNVGGFNIDECRVPFTSESDIATYEFNNDANLRTLVDEGDIAERLYDGGWKVDRNKKETPVGRFPANVILTYDESDYDEVCGGFPQSGTGNNKEPYNYAGREYNNKETSMFNGDKPQAPSNYNDTGSASRYFYCAKATRRDRDEGLEDFELVVRSDRNPELDTANNQYNRSGVPRKNFHPTCKPVNLMKYLVRLVTPKGGVVLDCFNGSGSTGKAVMSENYDRDVNYKYVGIELTEDYLPIAKARIEYAIDHNLNVDEKPKKEKKNKKTEDKKEEIELW